jgi:uncharacterized glyoxalase superfamily protein PhnB
MSVKPIPAGYHTITPTLAIDGAEHAIAFYAKAFGAEVVDSALDPSGKKIWHASLRIGDSMIFVNDVFPEMGGEPTRGSLWLYVTDCDAWIKRAVEAGAKPGMPPMDMFWGDRVGQVTDPFGLKWTIATHVKDMTPEEQAKARDEAVAMMKGKKD